MSGHTLTAEEQFVVYTKRLRDELDVAYTHYQIAKTFREFRQTRSSEFGEALTFFQVTMEANLFATVMTINRFMDHSNDCLQLHGFFELVRKNLALFSTPAFKTRLVKRGMDEEQIGHWAQLHVEITAEMLDDDEAKVKCVPVDHLNSWRNKKLAHIDKKRALENIDVMEANPVTVKEIDDVLTTLDEVLNRYSISYDGVGYSIGLPPVKQQMEHVMDAIGFYRRSRGEPKWGKST